MKTIALLAALLLTACCDDPGTWDDYAPVSSAKASIGLSICIATRYQVDYEDVADVLKTGDHLNAIPRCNKDSATRYVIRVSRHAERDLFRLGNHYLVRVELKERTRRGLNDMIDPIQLVGKIRSKSTEQDTAHDLITHQKEKIQIGIGEALKAK